MAPTGSNAYPIARSLKGLLGFSLILCLCLPGNGAQAGRRQTITFAHRERALQPGEVIVLEARSSKPLKNMSVHAFGCVFPAFAEQGDTAWTGLVGIDLDTKPGSHSIVLNGVDLSGNSVTARKVVQVLRKAFPRRKLTVDGKFVSPPQSVLQRIDAEREKVRSIFAAATPERYWRGRFLIPVPGDVVSAFGKRNVFNGQLRSPHTGTDFRGAVGTPIRSPNRARVALAEELYFSGNTIILDHGLGLYSYLGHMSEISVREGDYVETGSVIGKIGATGRVTGPHLHWTVRLGTARVDPISLVNILSDSRGNGR